MYQSNPRPANDPSYTYEESIKVMEKEMKRFWSDYYKDAVK